MAGNLLQTQECDRFRSVQHAGLPADVLTLPGPASLPQKHTTAHHNSSFRLFIQTSRIVSENSRKSDFPERPQQRCAGHQDY